MSANYTENYFQLLRLSLGLAQEFPVGPDATEDELREVLHTACADFVFDLPDGLNTELGERGSGLSEGQAAILDSTRIAAYHQDLEQLRDVSGLIFNACLMQLERNMLESGFK